MIDSGCQANLHIIQSGLRLSTAELAELLQVTRKTLCSWLAGAPPGPDAKKRIDQLAGALVPHLVSLRSSVGISARRAVDGRTTVFEALAGGANPELTLDRLAKIFAKETEQRARLMHRLRGRRGELGAADVDALG